MSDRIPEQVPPGMIELERRGWQHYITAHPEYSKRQVSAERLALDSAVFRNGFILGYMAGMNQKEGSRHE